MLNLVQEQADRIRANWGSASSERYLKNSREYDNQMPPIRTERWISNSQHQPKKFNNNQSAYVKMLKTSGLSCKNIAGHYGVSQGTISTLSRERGAYKRQNV